MNAHQCLGVWDLIPELCLYQQGEPPLRGRYEISLANGLLTFNITWTDSAGTKQAISFSGLLDGEIHAEEGPAISATMYDSQSPNTLNSTAYKDEAIVMTASRVASADGALLAVSQVLYADSQKFSNFQVYRRSA